MVDALGYKTLMINHSCCALDIQNKQLSNYHHHHDNSDNYDCNLLFWHNFSQKSIKTSSKRNIINEEIDQLNNLMSIKFYVKSIILKCEGIII